MKEGAKPLVSPVVQMPTASTRNFESPAQQVPREEAGKQVVKDKNQLTFDLSVMAISEASLSHANQETGMLQSTRLEREERPGATKLSWICAQRL